MLFRPLALAGALCLSLPAMALQYPIGAPHHVAGMEVGAVYLQPVEMEPDGHMRKVAESDLHLEADIHALAGDGPHYGNNAKLAGPGKYRVKCTVCAPSAPENAMGQHLGRYTDRATGVRPWVKPVTLEWNFTHAGIGKKGGY